MIPRKSVRSGRYPRSILRLARTSIIDHARELHIVPPDRKWPANVAAVLNLLVDQLAYRLARLERDGDLMRLHRELRRAGIGFSLPVSPNLFHIQRFSSQNAYRSMNLQSDAARQDTRLASRASRQRPSPPLCRMVSV